MELKDKYGYIETWTGARWVKEQNPYFGLVFNVATQKYKKVSSSVELFPDSTIRLHPITNEWKPITEADDEV